MKLHLLRTLFFVSIYILMITLPLTAPAFSQTGSSQTGSTQTGSSQTGEADRIHLAFEPDGGGEPVILSFVGEVFEEGRVLPLDVDPKSQAVELGEAESYLLEIFRTNREGSQKEVIELWRPEEREDVGTSVMNPSLFERNRSVMKRITRLVEHARVQFGRYVLIAVHQELDGGDGLFQLYILARQDGRYYQTSGPASDPVYSLLLNIFREEFGA